MQICNDQSTTPAYASLEALKSLPAAKRKTQFFTLHVSRSLPYLIKN